MPFARVPGRAARDALRDACGVPLWLDTSHRPEPQPPLEGVHDADLVVIGAGFTGLWAALLAVEAEPARRVVVLEAGRVAHAATGRNGGFCSASLTHGLANGADRFPDELPQLLRLGRENLDAIGDAVARYDIDCGFERSGDVVVATDPHHVGELRQLYDLHRRHGEPAHLLDAAEVRSRVADSPRYLAGLLVPDETALLDPARLAWGLAGAARQRGVTIHEGSAAVGLERAGAGVRVETAAGAVLARRAVLATNAFPPLLRRLRHYVVPVYDYVLATEPLPADVLASLGWTGRHGLSDAGNQFHYYRLTEDGRVVFGGYDAIYHRGNGFGPRYEQRPASAALLAEHLVETFPQLAGVRVTHSWGGAIDTCSRFCAFWGTALRGRVAYVAGYTGLGVGASRFGAAVALDLAEGRDTELTRLRLVRTRPLPFPPEPLRSIGIELTRRSLDRADTHGGRRNLWLRALDRAGLGFDS